MNAPRVLMVGQHTYQILSRRRGGLGGLGMQGGKAWVRRAYSGALNGLMNGVVSVLWKSAIGPFSILVFLYIMFVFFTVTLNQESKCMKHMKTDAVNVLYALQEKPIAKS